MKKFLKFNALVAVGFATMFGFSVQALPITDSTKNCKPLVDTSKKPPQINMQGLPERVHKRMNRALEMMAEERYDEAIEVLTKLAGSAKSDFVRASVYLNLAYATAQKGDQNGSLPHFKNALKFGEGSLPHERVQGLRYNVAALMYGIGEKKQSLDMMLTWLDRSVVHDPKSYYMIAALYAEENKYKDAMCPAYWAVKTEKEPKKSYYQALLAFHWESKDVNGAAALLREMIEHFPQEKTYWRQLSQIYLQQEKIDDAIAIMEMFYLKGDFDKSTDYRMMSSLFAYREIPYRAAQVLEEGLKKGVVEGEKKNWIAVAQNYHVSNELEKAIDAYGTTAEISDVGSEYLKQAEILTDEDRHREAVVAFDKALKKGGLDNEEKGRAYFRKGTTLVNMGSCDAGIGVLEQAKKFKKFRRQADQWISHANVQKRNNKC